MQSCGYDPRSDLHTLQSLQYNWTVFEQRILNIKALPEKALLSSLESCQTYSDTEPLS